ncbi:MAG: hypothetical protein PHU23_11005 [Dehalococcoidales bacterium]|nr:hypothetical protein [Dehalococcoidales bacterium]
MATYGTTLFGIRRGFRIIGLTGYTGSGCSTASRILRNRKKPELPGEESLNNVDREDYRKLNETWDALDWEGHTEIEVGAIIFMFIISQALQNSHAKEALGNIRSLALPFKKNLEGIKFLYKDADVSLLNAAKKLLLAYKTTVPIYKKFKQSYIIKLWTNSECYA